MSVTFLVTGNLKPDNRRISCEVPMLTMVDVLLITGYLDLDKWRKFAACRLLMTSLVILQEKKSNIFILFSLVLKHLKTGKKSQHFC